MWMPQCLSAAVATAAVMGSHLTWAFGKVASRCLKIVFSQMVTTHLQLPAAVTPAAQCSQAVAVHRSGSSKGVSLPIMQAASVPSGQAVLVQRAGSAVRQWSCPASGQTPCEAAAVQL